MAGCKACQRKKKKKHHHNKHRSSGDKKTKGVSCACCGECLCYKYGGKKDWYCNCGCSNCRCGLKVIKEIQKEKKK